jgi:hypothetical protein
MKWKKRGKQEEASRENKKGRIHYRNLRNLT